MSLRELQTKVAREGATAAGFLKRRIDIENRVIDMTGTEVRAIVQLIQIRLFVVREYGDAAIPYDRRGS